MRGYIHDLIGKKFGKLTVLAKDTPGSDGHSKWKCKCDCGNECVKVGSNIASGITKSCGCLRSEVHKTHGLRHTPIFTAWTEILRRCYDPKRKYFPRYGGKGILACEFIRATPVNLLALIGRKPDPSFSIDRKNNAGSYTCGTCAECLSKGWPLNVRWASRTVQNRNRNYVHRLLINGIVKTAPEWAESSGIGYRTIKSRMAKGLTGEALIAPVKSKFT